jgi:hypothetical protein
MVAPIHAAPARLQSSRKANSASRKANSASRKANSASATHHKGGAGAPGLVTPAESDDARELGSGAGTKGQSKADSSDCARAVVSEATGMPAFTGGGRDWTI